MLGANVKMSDKIYTLDDLLYLMSRLRDPDNGCPWDVKQTYASIVPSTIEEAYEVADAIEQKQWSHLPEELGDLLFQVIFYSQLGHEDQRFDFHSIVSTLVTKLVRRHPHVFPEGDLYGQTPELLRNDDDYIKQQWERIKQQERSDKGQGATLADIPVALPSLTRAQKLQKRAATVGFDWQDVSGPLAKVEEELQEVKDALAAGDAQQIAEEVGDLLFAAVNVARHTKQDAESVLRLASRKFEQRFNAVEAMATVQGDSLQELTELELDALWEAAKQKLSQTRNCRRP